MASIRALELNDSKYPHRLRALKRPPTPVFLQGSFDEQRRTVGIVGARAASYQHQEQARTLAMELARAGVIIISGGAFGIDAAAHEGAMSAWGQTYAILGTPLDTPYPKRHIPLFERLIEQDGCLISRYQPGTPVMKKNFPLRNEMIAALSDAVVLIQSPPNSGSRYTARAAQLLKKPVFVFSNSEEFFDLRHESLISMQSANDVLYFLETGHKKKINSEANNDTLSSGAARLLQVLSTDPKDLHQLYVSSGLEMHTCVSALFELEWVGLCVRIPGERYVATAE